MPLILHTFFFGQPLKRVTRIYPGFLFASLLCWFVVMPLGGGSLHLSAREWASAVGRALLLQPPDLGTVFMGTYYQALDGAMWTIAYEFRCYILVMVLGLAGILAHRGSVLVIAVVLLILSGLLVVPTQAATAGMYLWGPARIDSLNAIADAVIGAGRLNIRFMAIFMTGSSYFLFRENMKFRPVYLVLAGLALCGCLLNARLANAGTAIFGGLLILATARKATGSFLERINNEDDISYGTYLYAWPVEKLLFWWWPACPVILAGLTIFVTACLCGWVSWFLVEKPAMTLLRKRRGLVRSAAATPSCPPSQSSLPSASGSDH